VLHTVVIVWSHKKSGSSNSSFTHSTPQTNLIMEWYFMVNTGNLWDCTFPLWWNQTPPL